MTNNKQKIVFYGTPEFAVASLNILIENGYNVAAVVTVPDKPSGRGLKMKVSAVKQFALDKGLTVLQPVKLNDPEFQSDLKEIEPDLQVVVAFRKLPQSVWGLAPTFNLHASLLPDYRGAAPINWAIINGETQSGVTTFFINENIDTGDIILQKQVHIEPDDNAGSLHDKLAVEGSELTLETVRAFFEQTIKLIPQPQGHTPMTAPKLSKEFCRIDWSQDVKTIYNFIRGLSPYPAAWTMLEGKVFKIYNCKMHNCTHQQKAGTTQTDKNFKVFAQGGCLELWVVQIESKKRMPAPDFLRGWDSSKPIIFN